MITVFGSDLSEREIAAMTACAQSQWLGFGKQVEEFEKAFSMSRSIPNFAMVDNGSNALYMAVKLLDLPLGSEIILPSFTWIACANAILLAGCKPVFCDVDFETMNVRREDIECKISDLTGAIMIVHYAGLPVDIDPILKLGIPIIEDAAHAVDAHSKGRSCGSIGDIGIFSFDAVKNLTAGEGGGICARSAQLIQRAKKLRYCGLGKSGFDALLDNKKQLWWEHEITEPFIRMLPTNMAAAIALVQLERIAELQEKRRKVWAYYDEILSNIPEVTIPAKASEDSRHGLFTYSIKARDRNDLAKFLIDHSIYTTLRYQPLHLYPVFGQTDISLPNTERLNDQALSIPLHPRLTESDVSKVSSAILKFYRRS